MRRAHLPVSLPAVGATQGDLVSIAQCRDHGLTDKDVGGLVRRGVLTRVTRGVYDTCPTPVPVRPWDARRLRAAWAGLLAYGEDAVAVGQCALALHGVRGLPGAIRPEAAVPWGRNRRDRDGIALRQFDAGMTTATVGGRLVADIDWAIAQAVPELPRPNGLAVLDSALHLGLLDRSGLDRSHVHARGRRGVALRHALWTLADPRSESPLESFARLDCVDEGVPPHTLQLPVHLGPDSPTLRADMGWRRADGRWLVAELDGMDVHDAPAAVFADRQRQNTLVATGRLDVLRFTGRDVGTIGRTVRKVLLVT
ncbi:type IV toxin-antitoxin system AbiEi family antitoxin domain-containing protein [Cellulosimicrobium arenosum]|uniref:Type IV toxin-antitoxin system AbiEi family antitoxin domain-containing protein n=1 Tax=Cellulosimicrobium arenosum TaxID=2708133 RepID=A0A927J214_9MICO|nr:type IV toxin-antitoxin system AbiEi family antitoxin domain-containing protein [Cellulosimicrobium arenosum]MBD8080489.1 type IV toxin-antitoxin system AbiEi family antitoxin domain-containing protein [Cellulosimicrobium arenosum]